MATAVPTVVCRNPSVSVSQINTISLSQKTKDTQSGPVFRPARPPHQPCSGSRDCSKYLDTCITATGMDPALQRGTSKRTLRETVGPSLQKLDSEFASARREEISSFLCPCIRLGIVL
ncbi:hypothetical protein N7453_002370 [Penicillium expansum]|nr:hypothetical protein N7453_002370 [Penicillium expansum]